MPCVAVGFGMWTLGTGLKCMFSRTTHIGVVIGVLIVEGLGVGLTLQPSKSELERGQGPALTWTSTRRAPRQLEKRRQSRLEP